MVFMDVVEDFERGNVDILVFYKDFKKVSEVFESNIFKKDVEKVGYYYYYNVFLFYFSMM